MKRDKRRYKTNDHFHIKILKRFIEWLGIFKHDFREIGTGEVYGQKSSFYQCKKCRTTMYVPLGMQDMLIMKGCYKK